MNKVNAISVKNIHWFIRIVIATTFIYHGYPKVLDPSGLINMGLPTFLAYLVGPFELFGAIFLILGGFFSSNLTRIGAVLISIIMLGAIFIVHFNDGWAGIEWQLLILSNCLFFIIKGNDV